MTDKFLISQQGKLSCEMHKDIEDDAVITDITSMRLSLLRNCMFWLCVLLTGGIFYLLCYWLPIIRIRMTFIPSQIETSSHLYIKSKYFSDFVQIESLNSSKTGQLTCFKYQQLHYFYDQGTFKPLYFNSCLPNKIIIDTYSQGYSNTQDIKDLRFLYGACQIIVPVMPLFTMIITEALNPFYVFQVYSVILWYFEDYYTYSMCIVIITLISLISSIITTRRGLLALHDLAKKECRVNVVRNGQVEDMSSVELVPGDLVEIGQQIELPCDLVLIAGTCIVEEGMLTGESVPVLKDSLGYLDGSFYDPDVDKRHTLYEGTKVIQTRNYMNAPARAIVVRTGFATVKGRLIRSIMFPKPNKFKFYEDSMKFIGFLAILTLIGYFIVLPRMLYLEFESKEIAIRVLDLITIAIPPALPACMAAGIAFAINRLSQKKIYCIAPNRVNVAGRIDMMVFDKTGTLTEDGMNLLGVQGTDGHEMKDLKSTPKEESFLFVECMASCHSLALINGNLVGDNQDVQIFNSTGWFYEETDEDLYDPVVKAVVRPIKTAGIPEAQETSGKIIKYVEEYYEMAILHIFHFTSKLKRMGVIIQHLKDKRLILYMKGAPEVLLDKCSHVPHNINKTLATYTRRGYRVLACAYCELSNFDLTQLKSTKLEDLESNLTFIGLIILQNKLKPQTIPALKTLKEAHIKTIMATGDAVLTGISVGRECGLIESTMPIYLGELDNNEVVWQLFESNEASHLTKLIRPPWHDHSFLDNYVLALTGAAFNYIIHKGEKGTEDDKKALQVCLEKCKIYARMAPEHKTVLVEKLQGRGFLVGMCGDGANDCGALKTADVGISLSEADSSIAAPFTSQIADISSVLIVLKEGRCALTTSIQCFKYMALYSMIQFTSASFLYWYLGNLTNNQFLIFDLFTVMPLAIFMSMTGPYDVLSPIQPPSELISLRILASFIAQALLQAIFQILAYVIAINTYYDEPQVGPGDTPSLVSYPGTIIFYVSWFEYQTMCMAFSIGKPWKKPSYSNFLLTTYQILAFLVTLCFLFIDSSHLESLVDVRTI